MSFGFGGLGIRVLGVGSVVWGVGFSAKFRDITSTTENYVDKKMENEMEIGMPRGCVWFGLGKSITKR